MNAKLPMDVIAEYEALRASSSRLRDIEAGIAAKVRSGLGAQCRVVTDEQRHEVLTQRQRDWLSLHDFYSWMNSNDLFDYLGMIYRNPEAFRAIGATKTLTAAEALRDLYDQQQALETQEEKKAFLLQTLEQRQPIEQSADGLRELADLLIAFAEAHPDEFPSVPAGDAFDNLFSYLDALSEQITRTKQ